jgi:predicted RNA polymerase sigma factor
MVFTSFPIVLLDQDRARWDQLLINRGLAELARAGAPDGTYGPYGLQAAIAACHARARGASEADWARISALYDALAQVAPSPIVELNRAVAVGMALGPAQGLAVVDTLTSSWADSRKRAPSSRAVSLTRNARERDVLLARAGLLGRVG